MTRPLRLGILALFLLIGALHPVFAQKVGGPRPGTDGYGKDRISAPLDDDALIARLHDHVYALASDSMQGRRPPSAGNRMAADYIARLFDRAGLQPLVADGKGPDRFKLDFTYVSGVTAGAKNSVVINHGGSKSVLKVGSDVTPMAFSSNKSASSRLVFAGYGISDSAADYDDYKGINAKGAIAVIMRYSPDGTAPHGPFANASSWTSKVRNAIQHGVAGIIFINPPGDSADLVPMTMQRGFSDAGMPILFALDRAFADMRDASGRSLAQIRAMIDSTTTPSSFEPKGWTASVTADVHTQADPISNVAGLIPGNDPVLRNEVIVIGSHFDHLGLGGDGSLYRGPEPLIHYGADDNASGTAGMMALAEEFSRLRTNKRSLLFVGFNGEEEGLLGSAAFVKRFAEIGKLKYAAMVNMDMIGRLDSGKLVIEGTGTSPNFETMLTALNPGLRVKFSKSGYGSSDHTSFYGKQVPVLAFFTGTHKDYHKPSDTKDKINYEGERTIVRYVESVVKTLDTMGQKPLFAKADPPAGSRSAFGFSVYVGTIPDYAFEGRGMRINGASAGGPAEKAGLKEGDIIIRMGGMAVNNIYDYMDALGHFKPKQIVETEIIRDTEVVTIPIEMGAR